MNVAQVVEPSVLMYRRLVVVVAVVLMYSEPLAATTVPLGAPVPKNRPRLAVLDIFRPTGVAAAAAGAVPVKMDRPLLELTACKEAAPVTVMLSNWGSAKATPVALVFGMIKTPSKSW